MYELYGKTDMYFIFASIITRKIKQILKSNALLNES